MVIFQFANKLPEADRSMESDGIREIFSKAATAPLAATQRAV